MVRGAWSEEHDVRCCWELDGARCLRRELYQVTANSVRSARRMMHDVRS